jgi:hypothetical protein
MSYMLTTTVHIILHAITYTPLVWQYLHTRMSSICRANRIYVYASSTRVVVCTCRYCTDRYPKVESYGTCNWCLRADGGVAASTSSSPRSAGKAAGRPPAAAHGDTTMSSGGGRSPKVAARGDFASSNLSKKPIKKQQPQHQRLLLRRSASDLGSRAVRDAPPPSPGVVARGRPRIRRYKLLEEVISS